MKPSSLVRGGLALCLKPDSLRMVAISTGTGTPYFLFGAHGRRVPVVEPAVTLIEHGADVVDAAWAAVAQAESEASASIQPTMCYNL